MRIERADPTVDKGWYAGPWNSDLTVSVGYANEGIDEPHVHKRITEVYLVAHGTSEMRVEQETVTLAVGDMIADTRTSRISLSFLRCLWYTCL